MRKWRPSFRSIYVIPEIHGSLSLLENIFNRILPLRTHKNQEDILIMLGDYIDFGENSKGVIDCLINVKKEFGDRAIFLSGNHEELLLRSLQSDANYSYWIANGGLATIQSYTKSISKNDIPTRSRVQDLIGSDHLDFFSSLYSCYKLDNFLFFHGGINTTIKFEENNNDTLLFDTTFSREIKKNILKKEKSLVNDDYIYISAHNYKGKKPFIHSKFCFLGGQAPQRLFVLDLNSMQMCATKMGKTRIYKYNFKYFE